MFRTFIPISASPTDLKRNSGLLSRAEKKACGPREPKPGVSPRRILGVDPGLASSGWGVLEYVGSRLHYIAHGCIETEAGRSRAERLFFIYRSFCKIIDAYKPSESAIEKLYFGKNVTNAMYVAEARGVLSMALARRGIPVKEYNPNAIKQAVVGSASADKRQVQEMVRLILGLKEVPKPDHAADALGAAICCAHSGNPG
jgi:crossover junction endodeoxyribonuclease RuvC